MATGIFRNCAIKIVYLFTFTTFLLMLSVTRPRYMFLEESNDFGQCSDLLLDVPKSLTSIPNCSLCRELTCRDLLYGDPEVNKTFYEEVEKLMRNHSSRFIKPSRDDVVSVLNSSCEEFKKWREYDLSPVDPEEEESGGGKPFTVAFNILAHKEFEQIEKLLRSIYRPQNSYCIHVDNKSTKLVEDVKLLSSCFDNVFLPSKLEDIVYAGFSRLQADLNCMADHLERHKTWKYLINTASTGFPLKTNPEMVLILKTLNGSNSIVTIPTSNYSDYTGRFKYKFYADKDGVIFRSGKLHDPPPHNLTIVKGSAYGVFSRAFIEFMLTDSRVKDFLEWCKPTYSPDEHFWNTLHHTYSNPHINAPGGSRDMLNRHLPFQVNWLDEDKCYGAFVRGVCVFGVGDLPMLRKSPRIFLNKFRIDYQPLALECMENYLKYRRLCRLKFIPTYFDGS